jgi:hypothetical protein
MIGYQNGLDLLMEAEKFIDDRPGFFFTWGLLGTSFHVYTINERLPKRRVDEHLWVFGPPGGVVGVQLHEVLRLLNDGKVAPSNLGPNHQVKDYTFALLAMSVYAANYPLTIQDHVSCEAWSICMRKVMNHG